MVSIHTPTKGVTPGCSSRNKTIMVSIHTPTKGVTVFRLLIINRQVVSIHTPTKGVTRHTWASIAFNLGFNPHTHEGCDSFRSCPCAPDDSFNPHTHEGCDRRQHLRMVRQNRFQSTHPRRVWRWAASLSASFISVSIHTPTKGVTYQDNKPKGDYFGFQSTHPRRVWQRLFDCLKGYPCFNPHTHEGCDSSSTC